MAGNENHFKWHLKICYCFIVAIVIGQLTCYFYSTYEFSKFHEMCLVHIDVDVIKKQYFKLGFERGKKFVHLDNTIDFWHQLKGSKWEMRITGFHEQQNMANQQRSNVISKENPSLERKPIMNRMRRKAAVNSAPSERSIEYKPDQDPNWVWLSSSSRIPVSFF